MLKLRSLLILFATLMVFACKPEYTDKQLHQNKLKGESFLSSNKQKSSVIVTRSGLQYEVLREASGRKPKVSDKVKVHYRGKFIDGQIFDSSYQRKQPVEIQLEQVIKGWTEGLQLMSEGAKYRFVIPHNLAYGAKSSATMPGYTTLIFEVELLEVVTKRRIR